MNQTTMLPANTISSGSISVRPQNYGHSFGRNETSGGRVDTASRAASSREPTPVSASALVSSLSASNTTTAALVPVILALLPAVIGITLGKSAGTLASDVILLTVMAYSLWTLSEKTWQTYLMLLSRYRKQRRQKRQQQKTKAANMPNKAVSRRTSRETMSDKPVEVHPRDSNDEPTLGFLVTGCLLLHIVTPVIGGYVLNLSRGYFSTGPFLVSNLNIFLYVILEAVRTIRRVFSLAVDELTGDNGSYRSKIPTEPMLDADSLAVTLMQTQIEDISSHLNDLDDKLETVSSRMLHNESVLQSEVFSIYKVFEQVDHDLKSMSQLLVCADHKDLKRKEKDSNKVLRVSTSSQLVARNKDTVAAFELTGSSLSSGISSKTDGAVSATLTNSVETLLSSGHKISEKKAVPTKVSAKVQRQRTASITADKLSLKMQESKANQSAKDLVLTPAIPVPVTVPAPNSASKTSDSTLPKHVQDKRGTLLRNLKAFVKSAVKWVFREGLRWCGVPHDWLVRFKGIVKIILKLISFRWIPNEAIESETRGQKTKQKN